MIDNDDGFRVLKMAEDDSRCCFGLFGPLFHPYVVKKSLIWVVFQGACDGNVKTRRNIARKLQNSEILNFYKVDFLNDRSDRSEPSRPIDRSTDRPGDRSADPTDPKKKWGVWGGFAPPAKNILLFFKIKIRYFIGIFFKNLLI